MTTIKRLYDLQELDLDIDQRQERLREVELRLKDSHGVEEARAVVTQHEERLTPLRFRQREMETETEAQREKSRAVELKLYGGTVTNIRELQGLEEESRILLRRIEEMENQLLEAMVAVEECHTALAIARRRLQQTEAQWQRDQGELTRSKGELTEALASFREKRTALSSRIEAQHLRLYESLRQSRQGVAVAKVEGGACRGCRINLPTTEVQKARSNLIVQCNSCGRILYVS